MFFKEYSEFIYALYVIHYSKIDDKNIEYNNVFNDYITFNKHSDDFEEIYYDLINNTKKYITADDITLLSYFDGRLMSISELLDLKIKLHYLDNYDFVKRVSCIKRENNKLFCSQCHNSNQNEFFSYYTNNVSTIYCTRCVKFTRSDSRLPKFHINIPIDNTITINKPNVKLSPPQQQASDRLLHNLKKNKNSLVWAVCGAGKTEIIYNTVYQAILNNKKICLAVPRKDVVKELFTRFSRDFNIKINVLHGDKKILANSNFYIMTTHQLIKYYDYFDIVIIDEVDAFPYYGDELLEQGMLSSLTENSSLIFLSATPSKKIKNFVDDIIKIPIRYHRKLLPIPSIKIEKNLSVHSLSKILLDFLEISLNKKRRVLIFTPSILCCEQLAESLSNFYKKTIYCVHSKDKERSEKIENFRNGQLNILVTTTILERGVTFDYLDIIIFDAGHEHFTKEALVQISGRVGRKHYDTAGNIIFLTDKKKDTLNLAIKDIDYMNKLAVYRKLNED